MTASHTTRVGSDNSTFRSVPPETDPQTHQVVQLAHQHNEPTSSVDDDSIGSQRNEASTESPTYHQDSHNEYLIDERASSGTRQARQMAPTMEAS